MTVFATAFFLLINLIRIFVNGPQRINKSQFLLLIPLALYLVHIISSFYSSHKQEALFDLEQKLSFFIFPVILGLNKKIDKHDIKNILLSYLAVNLLFAIILLGRFVFYYFTDGVLLTYTKFHPNLHSTYFATYITLNLIISYHVFNSDFRRKAKNLAFFSVLFSLPLPFLAQSKAGIIIFILALSFYIFKILYHFQKKLGIISLIILIGISSFFTLTNNRFIAMLEVIRNYDKVILTKDRNIESTGERLMVWNASLNLVEDHYLYGVGNGDARQELHEQYLKMGYKVPAEQMLNSHNQYFETIIMTGLTGLLLLLAMMLLPIIYYHGDYRILILSFLLLFGLNFLFESMLNTQAGIIIFVFFYSFLIGLNCSKSELINDSDTESI